jgi:hypothetical protein
MTISKSKSTFQIRLGYVLSTTRPAIMYSKDTRTTLIIKFEQLLHQLITSSSPAHHQPITSLSPAYHQLITSLSPAYHQLIKTSTSPNYQRYLSSSPKTILPLTNHCLTSSTSFISSNSNAQTFVLYKRNPQITYHAHPSSISYIHYFRSTRPIPKHTEHQRTTKNSRQILYPQQHSSITPSMPAQNEHPPATTDPN